MEKNVHSIVNSNNVVLDELLDSKLVSFYATCGYLKEARRVFDSIEKKELLMYAKCGSMEDANSVFSSMAVKDINSWNIMIECYLKNFFPDEALKIFTAMLKELKSNSRTMACILPAWTSLSLRDNKLMT
ncbi:hypothetical protein GQ457_13G012030 [Hibiscus cannabinus]